MQYSQCPACNAWCKVQDLAILATTTVLTSAVVFVIHLTKIKVKKIHPWVLGLEAYIPIIMGWLTYQYYMTEAYKNKKQKKPQKQTSF